MEHVGLEARLQNPPLGVLLHKFEGFRCRCEQLWFFVAESLEKFLNLRRGIFQLKGGNRRDDRNPNTSVKILKEANRPFLKLRSKHPPKTEVSI